jgi:arylsulfatase A-like enzyme
VESIRVPLLIRHPRVLRPRVSELLIGTLDLMPTLLGMMGLKIPATCQGRNLTSPIRQAHDHAVDSVPLFLLNLDWRGLYTRRYTYSFDTYQPGGEAWYRESYFQQPAPPPWNCLFDRQNDPWEKRNLFDEPTHRKLRDRLHRQTLDWMKKLQDPCLPYDRVFRAATSPEDQAIRARKLPPANGSGILRGRPADLLAERGPLRY